MHPLTDCLVALAGTPDDSAWLHCQMVTLVQLTVDLVEPVGHSSVTVRHHGGHLTAATSDDVAAALDEKQYAEHRGPCVDALATETPTPVPDIGAVTAWPAFRDHASEWGLRASLSVPLFAGSGTAVAALNLHGHDPATMAPLIAGVLHVHGSRDPVPREVAARLDAGGAGLVGGLLGAFAVRTVIQQAIGVLVADAPADTHRSPGGAYQVLRQRAAEMGTPLLDTATRVLVERTW